MNAQINPQSINDWGNIILNEPDPLLREIWDARYTHVYKDSPMNEMVLIHETGAIKKIRLNCWRQLVIKLKTKTGRMPNGELHTWLSEGDGSADLFRSLIALEPAKKQEGEG